MFAVVDLNDIFDVFDFKLGGEDFDLYFPHIASHHLELSGDLLVDGLCWP